MNHLFRINQFSLYAKTKDAASQRTIDRKNERTRGRIVWSGRRGTYVRALHGSLKNS